MSDRISEETVRHIATLSRLKLGEDEVALFAKDLGSILGYMDQLNEVSVEGVEPTAHAVAVSNVLREDVVRESLSQAEALANAPASESGFFKVPKVLDQDSV